MTALVRLRCKRCRTVLRSIDKVADIGPGPVSVRVCNKCFLPSPRRIAGVLAKSGGDSFPMTMELDAEEIWTYAQRALATGAPIDLSVGLDL